MQSEARNYQTYIHCVHVHVHVHSHRIYMRKSLGIFFRELRKTSSHPGYICTCTVYTVHVLYLKQRPAALLVQERGHHRDASHYPHCILGQLCTRVTASDVTEGTDGRLNDVLPASCIVDGLKQSLGDDKQAYAH